MGRTKTHEQFVAELAKVRPELEALSLYRGTTGPMLVYCKNCGRMWLSTPRVLIRCAGGCKHCRSAHTSFQETFILEAFRYVLGDDAVVHRDTTAIGSELDILIPSLNFAVEPGGWIFHKDRVDRDAEKRELAEKAGIELITVYTGCRDHDVPEGENIISVDSCCAHIYEMEDLRLVTIELMRRANLNDIPTGEEQWEEIREKTTALYGASSRKDYVEMIAESAPDVELLEDVVQRSLPLAARCKKCGNEWMTTADRLIKGSQCPLCACNHRMSTDEYREKVAQEHPEITILGEYEGSGKKILARCDKGHEFYRNAGYLRHRGCPICNRNRSIKNANAARLAKLQAKSAVAQRANTQLQCV